MAQNIATQWTTHLKTPEEKRDFEKLLKSSRITMGRLKEMLEEKLAVLERAEVKVEHYDSPNWAYMQADTVGAKRTLRNILQLLSFLDP